MTDLHHDLRALATDIAWPETPDLTTAITTRPATSEGSDPFLPRDADDLSARDSRGLTPWVGRRLGLVLAAVLMAVPAAAFAVTPTRHAILDALGLRHVTVERRAKPPAAAVDPRLGRPVTLAAAAREAGFRPLVPAALGAPDAVYARGGVITMAFGRHLLLAQAAGDLPDEDMLHKVIAMDDAARRVRVAGAPGVFLAADHAYTWSDATGPLIRSGPALIWERGGRVLRLEGEPGLARARAIAESVS